MQVTINVSDGLLEKIEWYKAKTRQQHTEDVVSRLLEYALTMPPRQRLLEALRNVPDAATTMTEDEQLAMIDQIRQDVYEKRSHDENRD